MSNIFIIWGEDDFLVKEEAKKHVLASSTLETFDSLNSTNEDAQLRDIEKVKSSFLTPPFFEPAKTTLWTNAIFLPAGAKGKTPDATASNKSSVAVKAALEEFAKTIAQVSSIDNQVLIICTSRFLTSSVFAKTLANCAQFIAIAQPKNERDQRAFAADRIRQRSKELGLEWDKDSLDLFLSRVGFDTRSIYSELEKLSVYLGKEHKITEEIVDRVSSPGIGIETALWSICDAVNDRNIARAIEVAKLFELEDGFVIMLSTVLERHFRILAELKDASSRSMERKAIEGMNPWQAQRLMRAINNWRLGELRSARVRFMKVRYEAIKSSPSSDVIFITLARVFSRVR